MTIRVYGRRGGARSDGKGGLYLLGPGLQDAERLIDRAEQRAQN